MLFTPHIAHNIVFLTLTFKTFERAVQGLVFAYLDAGHRSNTTFVLEEPLINERIIHKKQLRVNRLNAYTHNLSHLLTNAENPFSVPSKCERANEKPFAPHRRLD